MYKPYYPSRNIEIDQADVGSGPVHTGTDGAAGVVAQLLSFCTLPREPGVEAGKAGGAEGEAAVAADSKENSCHGGRADAEALDGKGVNQYSPAVEKRRAGGMNI